jgi:hypothetical protein
VLIGWSQSALPSTVIFSDPAGPNGLRMSGASALFIAHECYMGTADVGGTTLVTLPDADLISTPILE